MIFGEGIFGLALLALWVFCIFDVISADEVVIRNLPKILWLLIVIFIPDIGSIAWLILGRPQGVRYSPGSTRVRRTPIGPEDSPTFMSALEETKRLRRWEDELKRREERLRRTEDESQD